MAIGPKPAAVQSYRTVINPYGCSAESYKPLKGDQIDVMLGEFLNQEIAIEPAKYIATLPEPIRRVSKGQYNFGPLKLYIKSVNGKLVARVGGGWVPIEEFFARYSTINKPYWVLHETHSLTTAIPTDLPHYALPTSSKSFLPTTGNPYSPPSSPPLSARLSASDKESNWKKTVELSPTVRNQLFPSKSNPVTPTHTYSSQSSSKSGSEDVYSKLSKPRNPKPPVLRRAYIKPVWKP
jgi:hypothetical protein